MLLSLWPLNDNVTQKSGKVTRQIQLDGELTRHSVASHSLRQHKKLFQSEQLDFDLAKVKKVDTAGLAWLLSMIEYGNSKNIVISFSNLPSDLVKLAKLSGVEQFIDTK